MAKKLNWVILLSLIGAASSFYLSKLHFDLHEGRSSFSNLCSLSKQMNCETVAMSRFSEIFPGIPLSSLALGVFLAMIAFSLMAKFASDGPKSDETKSILKFMYTIATVSMIFSIIYALIMVFVLKTGCLFCMVIDGVNLGNLILIHGMCSKEGLSGPFTPFPSEKNKSHLMTLVVIVAGSIGLGQLFGKTFVPSEVSDQIEASYQKFISDPKAPFDVSNSNMRFGDPNAKVVIVKFSDFQCPHCKLGALLMKGILAKYPDKVQVVLKNFPLDSKCNRLIESQGHAFACEAAKATYCAAKKSQSAFEAVYVALYENQDLIESKGIEWVTKEALDRNKLTYAELKPCIDAKETQELIAQDIEMGLAAKVQSTPTFFVNGAKIEGALPMEFWVKVVDFFK